MPICTSCEIDKPETAFTFRDKSGARRSKCKECTNLYQSQHYAHSDAAKKSRRASNSALLQRARKAVFDYLNNHPCIDCGEDDPIVLEFDHREPSAKKASVSEMIRGKLGLAAIMAEIEKCDVRCANCHKRRTATQFSWHKRLLADYGMVAATGSDPVS